MESPSPWSRIRETLQFKANPEVNFYWTPGVTSPSYCPCAQWSVSLDQLWSCPKLKVPSLQSSRNILCGQVSPRGNRDKAQIHWENEGDLPVPDTTQPTLQSWAVCGQHRFHSAVYTEMTIPQSSCLAACFLWVFIWPRLQIAHTKELALSNTHQEINLLQSPKMESFML